MWYRSSNGLHWQWEGTGIVAPTIATRWRALSLLTEVSAGLYKDIIYEDAAEDPRYHVTIDDDLIDAPRKRAVQPLPTPAALLLEEGTCATLPCYNTVTLKHDWFSRKYSQWVLYSSRVRATFRRNTNDMRRPAGVIMIFVDALMPNRHQGISNNHSDSIEVMVSHELYYTIRIA